jgi:hypothetical protein
MLLAIVVGSTQDQYHRAGRGVQHAQQKDPTTEETDVADVTGAV